MPAVFMRYFKELLAVFANERFVGGDHNLALRKGATRELEGRAGAAHQFANNINFGIIDHAGGVVGVNFAWDVHAALAVQIFYDDLGYIQRRAEAVFQRLAIFFNIFPDALADHPEAEESNANCAFISHYKYRGVVRCVAQQLFFKRVFLALEQALNVGTVTGDNE